MKKYLLLVEDEELWEKFKKGLSKDINSEIMDLIEDKVHRSVYPKERSKGAKKRKDDD